MHASTFANGRQSAVAIIAVDLAKSVFELDAFPPKSRRRDCNRSLSCPHRSSTTRERRYVTRLTWESRRDLLGLMQHR